MVMTIEEARGLLIDISYKLGNMSVEYLSEKDGEKMREAISVLEQEPTTKNEAKYCDRSICLRNEYNNVGCEDCEVTKSQELTTKKDIPTINGLDDFIEFGKKAFGVELTITQQKPQTFKWCTDCREYDQEKHCCHRWSKVIRDTVAEMKQEYISKADYENRLKADMVAMLTDLQLEIEEMQSREVWCDYATDNCIDRCGVDAIIRLKINSLKENTNVC